MDSLVAPKQEEQGRAGDDNQGQLRILSSLSSVMVIRQVRPNKVLGLAKQIHRTGLLGQGVSCGPDLGVSVGKSPRCDFSWLFSQQCGLVALYQR